MKTIPNVTDQPSLSELDLNEIYNWVDEIPLSRPKKSIARDFADGCQVAEIIYHFYPQLVELHNYQMANSVSQKTYNWTTLNQKVFRKMDFMFSKTDIDAVITCQPEAIEKLIKQLKYQVEAYDRKVYEQKEIQAEKKMIVQNMQDNNNKAKQKIQYDDIGKKFLEEKDQAINELRETVEILELKIKKLEQLVQLKDNKIQTLVNKLQNE